VVNLKEIEFVGVTSGDGECFMFKVDEDNFKKATGNNPADWDNANQEWDRELKLYVPKGDVFKLYPNDIFGDSGEKLKVKVIVEKLT